MRMIVSVSMAVVMSGSMFMPAVILRVVVIAPMILPLIVGAVVAVIVGVSGVVVRVVRHGRQLNGTGSPGERAASAMVAGCERARSR